MCIASAARGPGRWESAGDKAAGFLCEPDQGIIPKLCGSRIRRFPGVSPTRSSFRPPKQHTVAGWSSPVAREAHNLEVAGSNPVPAISRPPGHPWPRRAVSCARHPGGQTSGWVAGPSMAPAGCFFAACCVALWIAVGRRLWRVPERFGDQVRRVLFQPVGLAGDPRSPFRVAQTRARRIPPWPVPPSALLRPPRVATPAPCWSTSQSTIKTRQRSPTKWPACWGRSVPRRPSAPIPDWLAMTFWASAPECITADLTMKSCSGCVVCPRQMPVPCLCSSSRPPGCPSWRRSGTDL